MLYIGNFSYSDENDVEDNYCLMPCVVEAADPEDALDKFSILLERLHESSELLDGATEVYLDSLVEFDGTPSSAVMVQWQKIVPSADGLASVSSALPEADSAAVAYGFEYDEDEVIDDLVDDEGDDDEDEDDAMQEPFLTF